MLGYKVSGKSDETGEVAYKEVVGLFQKQADEIYYVHIGDEIIEVTGEHPFWLDGRGWTYVKDLKVGDLLLSSDGTKLAIDKIEKESREATVYNFEVEDYHSYFVSNLGIWVHNCDINLSPLKLLEIEHANLINPRDDLFNKIKIRGGVAGKPKSRHLTKYERNLANQILDDISAQARGDAGARARLEALNDHVLDNRQNGQNFAGWNSVYIRDEHGNNGVMRIIYKQTDNGIDWNVVQWH